MTSSFPQVSMFTSKEGGGMGCPYSAEVVPTLAQGLYASLHPSPTVLPLLRGASGESEKDPKLSKMHTYFLCIY